MLQLKFADCPASMMVWRVRCTGPEYPSVGSAAPGAGTSGIFFNVTTFMRLSRIAEFPAVPSAQRPVIASRIEPSHIAVPALDGLADHRRRDLVGDLDVPDFALTLGEEVGEQLRNDRHIAYFVPAQAKAAGDVFHRRPTEQRQTVVDALAAQFVKFRAVPAVVHGADQDAVTVALQGLELLDVEQEPAVAFEQHDLALP